MEESKTATGLGQWPHVRNNSLESQFSIYFIRQPFCTKYLIGFKLSQRPLNEWNRWIT